ncbi:unnamed protein product [Peniophora sp. CBMAI 1063]|nr:unnamed protein product [Peniophora sp. CBMAI 1063]
MHGDLQQPPSWAHVEEALVVSDQSPLGTPLSNDVSDHSSSTESKPMTDVPLGYSQQDLNAASPMVPDPGDMLEKLRVSYATRCKRGPLTPELRDISIAFTGLMGCVRSESVEHVLLWDRMWQIGLGDLCEEIVEESDFYSEHPDWIITVLEMVDLTVSRYARERPRLIHGPSGKEQLQRLIVSLCRTGYCHRELFTDDNVVLRAYAPGATADLRFRLQHLLNMSFTIYGKAGNYRSFDMGSADATRHFRRMTTLLWCYRTPGECWQSDTLITLSLTIVSESPPEDCIDFFDNEVLKLSGPYNFLTRICDYLRRRDFPTPVCQERLLQGLGRVIAFRPLWPHYSSSGFFNAMKDMLDSYASLNDADQWHLSEAALNILAFLSESAPINDAASHLIRHFDIIEYVSRSSIIYARSDAVLGEDDNACVEALKIYTRIAAALSLRTGKNLLKKVFRQAARREWYRTLVALREIQLRNEEAKRKCTPLISAWQTLGRALNLDEASEKIDYEREMKKAMQMCAWLKCDYHQKRSPHPTRACLGCAEARYCSRECQQKDWREGRHKARCRRLKAEAHSHRQ